MERGYAAHERGVTAHVFVGALADELTVAGADGHHLQRVRRIEVGERITAADGSGVWRSYEVIRVEKSGLALRALDAVRTEPEPVPRVTVAVALISRSKLDSVVMQLSELGVSAFVPVAADRCVVQWNAAKTDAALTRLRVIAREAAMQCRRATLMEVHALATVDSLVGRPELVVAAGDGASIDEIFPRGPGPRPETFREQCLVLSGPEGGFSDREHAIFVSARVARLRLGPHVLRAETAPIVAATLLSRAT